MRSVAAYCLAGVLSVCASSQALSKDFGKHGTVYEIDETPFFKMIRDQLGVLEENGRLDEVNEELRRNSIKTIEAPAPVEGLGEVKEAYNYIFDPSITVQEDIKDLDGNLIAPAGLKVNPLEHIALGDELLFIRGDRESHMKLARQLRDEKNGKLKVIFISGEPLKVMRDDGFRIFFDQGGAMVRRFEITKVPALVTQEDLHLNIMEIPADGL